MSTGRIVAALFSVFIGMLVGNVLYQEFTDANWGIVAERTWFQGLALFCAFWSLMLWMWRTPRNG